MSSLFVYVTWHIREINHLWCPQVPVCCGALWQFWRARTALFDKMETGVCQKLIASCSLLIHGRLCNYVRVKGAMCQAHALGRFPWIVKSSENYQLRQVGTGVGASWHTVFLSTYIFQVLLKQCIFIESDSMLLGLLYLGLWLFYPRCTYHFLCLETTVNHYKNT